jgi:hypothetical protein
MCLKRDGWLPGQHPTPPTLLQTLVQSLEESDDRLCRGMVGAVWSDM